MPIIITADVALSAPLPNTPMTPLPNPVLTSDTFTGGDRTNITGRVTDCGLGGLPVSWTSSGGVRVVGGYLAPPATEATGVAYVPAASADVEVAAVVHQMPSSDGQLTLIVRAANTSSDTSNNGWRMSIGSGGNINLARRSGGTTTSVATVPEGTVVVGDRVALRCVGNKITVLVNNIQRAVVTDAAVAVGAFAGLSTYADSAARLASFLVRAIDAPEFL